MTLYYTLVFALLMAEMGIFMLLVVPFPFKLRRKIFTFLAENPIVAKIQYGLKITFVFILILFVDSVNRVYRVQVELGATSENGANGAAAILGRERSEVQARKFYSQRNMYLCGFTLFLSLILNRTYTMVLDVLRLEERVKTLEGPAARATRSSTGSGSAKTDDIGEVASLRTQLASKDADLQTIKKQAEGLQREYAALCDKYNETQVGSFTGTKKTN